MGSLGMSIRKRLQSLFQEMYELTEPECSCSCRLPRSCCAPDHCELAIMSAKELWGVDISVLKTGHEIPFMGEEGCILEPHFRPNCTVHTCDIMAFGFKMHPAPDPEWDKKYWALREEIDKLSWELHNERRLEKRS